MALIEEWGHANWGRSEDRWWWDMVVQADTSDPLDLLVSLWERQGPGDRDVGRVWCWDLPGGILMGALFGTCLCFWRVPPDLVSDVARGIQTIQREYGYAGWYPPLGNGA